MRFVMRFVLLCALLSGCAHETLIDHWVVQELDTNAEFRDAFFLDADRGWIVGGGYNIDGGIIGKTVDGGLTWSFRSGVVRPTPRRNPFRFNAVQFLNDRHGLIATDSGLLRTVDGGEHWHRTRGAGQRSWTLLLDMHFVDDRYGWAIGSNGIVRTVDGGESWEVPTRDGETGTRGDGTAIHFLDHERGWLVGKFGKIQSSDDGGATWTPAEASPLSGKPDLRALYFADDVHGWAVGEYGTIVHTSDGGKSWRLQDSGTPAYLTAVSFADTSVGWAVGYERSDGSSTVLHTVDGGVTWTPQIRVEGEELNALFVIDSRNAWAVGDRVRRGTQKLLRFEPGAEEKSLD